MTPSLQFGTWARWNGSLYNYTEDGLVYLCDNTAATQDDDGSTPAPVVPYLQLREFHDNGLHQTQYKRIAVLCDTASVLLDAFWTDKRGNVNYTSGTTYPTLNIATTTQTPGYVMSTIGTDLIAPSAYPTIKGQLSTGLASGKQVYAIIVETVTLPGDKFGS